MIAHADTIVDPGAVMIEALHTVPADGAVPATTRADCATVWAQLSAVYHIEHVFEVDLFVSHIARILAGGDCEESETSEHEGSVEADFPYFQVYKQNDKVGRRYTADPRARDQLK